MSTPINRMKQYYADVAAASTIDYVGYCIRRIYPLGGVSWHHRQDHDNNRITFGIAADSMGHAFITRFHVPVDAGGAAIKIICREAADTLDNMILRLQAK
jgi:hypothetical protein